LARVALALAVLPAAGALAGQQAAVKPDDVSTLTESGHVTIAGRETAYMIHRLPVSSFPELPPGVVGALTRRGCRIPQSYEAHRPENVIHASLERPGSSDWAVLCSNGGTVSLLVFFEGKGTTAGPAGEPLDSKPVLLASAPETQYLDAHDGSGVLGFDWAIDKATPDQVHAAQDGMAHRPARLDHDAVAETIVEHRTVYHFYEKNAWAIVALPR
jgi:hypothetical protein